MLKVHQTARLTLLLGSLLGAGGLAGACGSGLGDGATDDGTTPLPLSGAGRNNVGQAGANNQAGANSQAGATTSVAGTTASGASSALGDSSGSGGTVGVGGSSGAVAHGGSTAGAPAGGSTGTAADGGGGTGGVSLFCGDGIIGGSEQCDDKAQTPLCSANCMLLVTKQTCVDCESMTTIVDTKPVTCPTANCIGTFSGDQQNRCDAVLLCVNASNCFDGAGTLDGSCYCGTLSLSDCQAAPFDLTKAGAPNGPCATAIQSGFAGLTSNSDLLAHLTDATQPAGAALARLTCQKSGAGGSCKTVCGF